MSTTQWSIAQCYFYKISKHIHLNVEHWSNTPQVPVLQSCQIFAELRVYVNYGVVNIIIWSYDNCWIIAVRIIDFLAIGPMAVWSYIQLCGLIQLYVRNLMTHSWITIRYMRVLRSVGTMAVLVLINKYCWQLIPQSLIEIDKSLAFISQL